LIELEKNYALVADLLGHLLDRLEKIERHVESLEKKFISTRIKSATESRKKKRKTR
jgi:DNA anti-recombination protein RmuC